MKSKNFIALFRLFGIGKIVESVKNAFAQIDKRIIKQLYLNLLINLDSRRIHDPEILEVVLPILHQDGELGTPEALLSQD